MEVNPIEYFNKWFIEELDLTKARVPTACCLSTIGTDNYPNARFVSLKEVVDNNFIVTGTITSRKGIEIAESNKVALTFWWTETERQVRIQGTARIISDEMARKYFAERNRESQIVSIVSDQGKQLKNMEELNEKFQTIESSFAKKTLAKPENWSGYSIEPVRIEFLEFKASRFHDRELYELQNGQWITTRLQP